MDVSIFFGDDAFQFFWTFQYFLAMMHFNFFGRFKFFGDDAFQFFWTFQFFLAMMHFNFFEHFNFSIFVSYMSIRIERNSI